jgi:tRNA-uridine 2-sulfurtransferase
MSQPVVAIALSGGIDSLVAGYLLKQRYKNVFGIHFKTGYEKNSPDISGIRDQLGISVSSIDISSVFEKKIVSCFVQTYLKGKTPNPCIICNREIKFGVLLSHVLSLGADFLATGHYAKIVNRISSSDNFSSRSYLEKAEDRLKDQSYFLSMLSSSQLEKIIFPLAGMTKDEVRALAMSRNLSPVHKKESQDVCFIHDQSVSEFILKKKQIRVEHGDIINTEGIIIGRHNGLYQFTIGQRRGINVPAEEPYYVKKLNMENNTLEVCFKKELATKSFQIERIHWNEDINENSDRNTMESTEIRDIISQIRYNHKGALSSLIMKGDSGEVSFYEAQNAVTPGQVVVFYKSDRVLGAAFIK